MCTGPQYKGADYFYVIVDLQAYYLADGVYKSCYRAGTVSDTHDLTCPLPLLLCEARGVLIWLVAACLE